MNKAIKINKKFKNTFKGKTIYFNDMGLKKFKLKRFFIITPNNKKVVRGEHAHSKCDQILIVTEGLAKIKIFNKTNKIFNLQRNEAVYVPKKHWIEILFKKKMSSILVLCNYKFDLKEYIFNKKKLT